MQDTLASEGVVTRFIIPPGVAHAIRTLGTRPTPVVVFRARAYNPADPDAVREVLIEG